MSLQITNECQVKFYDLEHTDFDLKKILSKKNSFKHYFLYGFVNQFPYFDFSISLFASDDTSKL